MRREGKSVDVSVKIDNKTGRVIGDRINSRIGFRERLPEGA